ncbi:hypothetical protein MLC52_05420 [Sulfurimonas sp. NW15]|uniref:hypothetical protein n=1 Tax=Sulfurimonas sp. NW15 TaxID=2922729 RepID=UPI003DA85538
MYIWIAIAIVSLGLIQLWIYISNRIKYINYEIDLLGQCDTKKVDQIRETLNNIQQRVDYLQIKRSCFVGVGGGGCNILQDIMSVDSRHKFIMLNSDLQALKQTKSKHKILLSYDKKKGLGCGGNEACGMQIFDEIAKNKLRKKVKNYKKIFVVVALGGGVGSGTTPEIVQYLQLLNKKVYVAVVMPFDFEGKMRQEKAKTALEKIEKITKHIIIMKNNNSTDTKSGVKETFFNLSIDIYDRVVMYITKKQFK